jgi:hypothetical protein
MRAMGLFFLAMSCATCTPRLDCAEQPGAALPQLASRKTADTAGGHPHDAVHAALADGRKRSDQHPGSGKDQSRNHATITKGAPKQLLTNRRHSQSGNAVNAYQRGSDRSSSAAKGGLIPRETTNRVSSPHSPSVIRPAAPHLTAVRHRGANPAVVGGSKNSAVRNVGAISGTNVHRRP